MYMFEPRSGHVVFVADKLALETEFLGVLRFPLPILIPETGTRLLIILSSTLCSTGAGSVKKKPTQHISCNSENSIPKMEMTCSSETSVDFQRTTRRYIPEHSTYKITVLYLKFLRQ
jgi:hypothetical protein